MHVVSPWGFVSLPTVQLFSQKELGAVAARGPVCWLWEYQPYCGSAVSFPF